MDVEVETPFEFEECGYACESREKLDKHLLVHAVGLKCVPCSYKASSRTQWREHILSPLHVQTHKCKASDDCAFVGETAKHLKQHLKIAHGKERSAKMKAVKCAKCDYIAESFLQLRKHSVLVHKKEEMVDTSTGKFICPICRWSAESERKFKNHLWRHGGDEQRAQENGIFHCDQENCDFTTSRKPRLESHKLRHMSDPPKLKCPDCPKSFTHPENLRTHRRLHTKRAIFACPVKEENCKYTTTMADYLRAHVKKQHPDRKLIKCSKCDFMGTRSEEMRAHVKDAHPLEGLLICEKCGYETVRAKCYERHLASKHCSSPMTRKSRCVIGC